MIDLVAGERNLFLLVSFPQADGDGTWIRVVVYEISDGTIVRRARFRGRSGGGARVLL